MSLRWKMRFLSMGELRLFHNMEFKTIKIDRYIDKTTLKYYRNYHKLMNERDGNEQP